MPTISESRPQVCSETSICHGPGLKSLRGYYVSHFPSVNYLGINKELSHYLGMNGAADELVARPARDLVV